MTEKHEKAKRAAIMQEQNCSELEAVHVMAGRIAKSRRNLEDIEPLNPHPDNALGRSIQRALSRSPRVSSCRNLPFPSGNQCSHFRPQLAVPHIQKTPHQRGSSLATSGQDLPFPDTENPADAGFLISDYR